MTDTRIALDYLQDLFAKLAAGRQDPSRVDWPFAAECWRAVCGEIERLQSELAIANKDFAEMSRTYVETREERDQARIERDDWAKAYLRLCTETGRVPVLTWEERHG